jgi:hypothetical protein
VIARWSVIDKYAEHPDQINLSPYAYVGNNPINKTDLDGNCPGPPCDIPPLKDNTATRVLTDANLAKDIKVLNSEASQVFSGNAKIEGSVIGAGVSVTAGPLTVKAGAGVLNGSVGIDGKVIKLDGSVAQVNGVAAASVPTFWHEYDALDKSGKATRAFIELSSFPIIIAVKIQLFCLFPYQLATPGFACASRSFSIDQVKMWPAKGYYGTFGNFQPKAEPRLLQQLLHW